MRNTPKTLKFTLVQKYGENYRRGEAREELEQADKHGVSDHIPKQGIVEKHLKIFGDRARPFAAENATCDGIVLKDDQKPAHRQITKDKEPNERRQDKQIAHPFFADMS